jgi:hypothetical protein
MEFKGQYLTYQEYKQLGGTLDITPFNLLEFEARKNIDKYTLGRLKNLDSQVEEVKMCVFKLIGSLNSYNTYETQNKAITSESIDGYSISYGSATTETTKAKNSEIEGTIRNYLSECYLEDGTPYLYVGVI